MSYWNILGELIRLNELKIDRRKGESHPLYKHMIYPVDYGYIMNTKSMDGSGIDIFVGGDEEKKINGIFCTADRLKMDSEIKIIYGCCETEIELLLSFLNNSSSMKAIFIKNESCVDSHI